MEGWLRRAGVVALLLEEGAVRRRRVERVPSLSQLRCQLPLTPSVRLA
ncbi:MAG: hypothetical protein FWG31_07655 [Oscillospiraceae bacterium]|nr:hypothetical protein [Oscillospiraceae bacterium]